eukprot:9332379-Alexandrium_andersonii.AAC.1
MLVCTQVDRDGRSALPASRAHGTPLRPCTGALAPHALTRAAFQGPGEAAHVSRGGSNVETLK